MADEVRQVDPERWADAAAEHVGWLPDLLTAVDLAPRRDAVEVVLRLWSLEERRGVRLHTVVPRPCVLPSLTPVWPGLGWWEREAAETYQISFEGHPDPRPLLGVAAGALERRHEQWPGSFDPMGKRSPEPLR
jgi:NADH:ubiquinone oxidoreductase subunit C